MVDYVLLGFSAFIGVVIGEISKDLYHSIKKYFKSKYLGGEKTK